jgi:hypothetical protein
MIFLDASFIIHFILKKQLHSISPYHRAVLAQLYRFLVMELIHSDLNFRDFMNFKIKLIVSQRCS